MIIGYNKNCSLYLLDTENGLFLGNMKLMTKSNTIEEYLEWLKNSTANMISLSNSFPPQRVYHSDIKQAISVEEIIGEILDENGMVFDCQKIDPSIEVIIDGDFRQLLIKLFQTGLKLDFITAKKLIKEYYSNLIRTEKKS